MRCYRHQVVLCYMHLSGTVLSPNHCNDIGKQKLLSVLLTSNKGTEMFRSLEIFQQTNCQELLAVLSWSGVHDVNYIFGLLPKCIGFFSLLYKSTSKILLIEKLNSKECFSGSICRMQGFPHIFEKLLRTLGSLFKHIN